jgi:hypothetical protein
MGNRLWEFGPNCLSPLAYCLGRFGGNSEAGSARACWLSSHSPQLADRLAQRVLFLVDVILFHLWARV